MPSDQTARQWIMPTRSPKPRDSKGRAAQPPTNLLWLDFEQGKLQDDVPMRERRAFIASRHHQLRKASRLQKLKDSIQPFPTTSAFPRSHDNDNDDDDDEVATTSSESKNYKRLHSRDPLNWHARVSSRSLAFGVQDAFPSVSGLIHRNGNFYFDHWLIMDLVRVIVTRSAYPFTASAMTHWFCQRALDWPPIMEAMLSTGAAIAAASLGESGSSALAVRVCMQDALQLRSQTIKSLQELLDNPSQTSLETALVTINWLVYIENNDANEKAVAAHTYGLRSIIQSLGGLGNLNHKLLSLVYCCDIMRAVPNRFQLTFKMLSRWEKRVLRDFESLLAVNPSLASRSLGSRFFNSPWSRDLTPEMTSIIQSLQYLILCHERVIDGDSRAFLINHDRLILLAHQMMSVPKDYCLTPFQDTLLFSVLIYTVTRIWQIALRPTMEMMVQNLRRKLDESFTILQDTAPDLLFWMLFISSFGSQGLDDQVWFVAHLLDIADLLGLEDWDSVRLLLEGFFFVCRPDEPAQRFWDSISQDKRLELLS
ncbi:uncharacterized protein N7459_000409 [Penicillium hispanicum]|uniref:uncharacterized protein n=1 Tax=Penicillium hispanicum TaxID=1080232 RepID=UPI002541E2C5|nr:uncharacterized protein N7459_000409 [Penicillium hispanicum]KAJ5594201.1 hypothetical protein N7459_000409 [Penicillium hispanicum]